MNKFWTWWTSIIKALHLPEFESAPGEFTLLVEASLPMAFMAIFLGLIPVVLWASFIIAAILSMIVRYSPWFHRPESVHLNMLWGWVLGQIVNLVWHHSLPL